MRRERCGSFAAGSRINALHHPATLDVSKPEMKLLVLAQTPPPVHGQSVMVQALVDGLPRLGIAVHHVNLQLSRESADIGRWRPGKIFATVGCALRALAARFRHGCDTFYYVPAPPGKRGALYRDWVVMAICRPFFRRLVLHWHAAGLGEELQSKCTRIEAALTQLFLGDAALGIVLAQSLRSDAEILRARRIEVVPNGITDPKAESPLPPGQPCRALFLSRCSEEKGLFAAAAATLAANARLGGSDTKPHFTLIAAGPFDDEPTAARFLGLCQKHPGVIHYAGTADEAVKCRLFRESHLLLFPTRYSAEGMPLVAIEALAHDRPVVGTHWRALPEIVTDDVGILVPANDDAALVDALLKIQQQPPAPGVCRTRYLAHYTQERHMSRLRDALHGALT
jgi:glycosyltransferase involved in cell wall biosynthesis